MACELREKRDYAFTGPTGGRSAPRSTAAGGICCSKAREFWTVGYTTRGTPAATVLLLLGVPERTVMSGMGWVSAAIVARYQYVVTAARRDVAARVGDLIWTPKQGGEGRHRTPEGADCNHNAERRGLLVGAARRSACFGWRRIRDLNP